MLILAKLLKSAFFEIVYVFVFFRLSANDLNVDFLIKLK